MSRFPFRIRIYILYVNSHIKLKKVNQFKKKLSNNRTFGTRIWQKQLWRRDSNDLNVENTGLSLLGQQTRQPEITNSYSIKINTPHCPEKKKKIPKLFNMNLMLKLKSWYLWGTAGTWHNLKYAWSAFNQVFVIFDVSLFWNTYDGTSWDSKSCNGAIIPVYWFPRKLSKFWY